MAQDGSGATNGRTGRKAYQTRDQTGAGMFDYVERLLYLVRLRNSRCLG